MATLYHTMIIIIYKDRHLGKINFGPTAVGSSDIMSCFMSYMYNNYISLECVVTYGCYKYFFDNKWAAQTISLFMYFTQKAY